MSIRRYQNGSHQVRGSARRPFRHTRRIQKTYSSAVIHYSLLPIPYLRPWRFSSEYAEDETATVYYNYRHYEPVMGRWSGRDPEGEDGGVLLYGAFSNGPIASYDILGLWVKLVRDCGGCKCKDIDDEAKEALKTAVNKMNASQARHEWFGSICCKCKDDLYTAFHTGPFEGRTLFSKHGKDMQEQEVSDQTKRYAACPTGSKLVGYYHTHPDGSNLSSTDLDLIRNMKIPTYMSRDGIKVQRGTPRRTNDPKAAGWSAGSIYKPDGFPMKPKVDVL